jgi:2',3'-cyclic-nucleotide 2'-phosphodiesterase (5'-nucleotidase family)
MLLLDAGNFSDNPTASGDLKTRGLLNAMERLGYQVVNVGERDIRMGYPEFVRRTEGTPFQYVSSNIVDRKTKKPVFDPHAIVEASSSVRVGVIGAVRYNPVFLKAGPDGGNIVIAHPLESVKRELAVLRKKKVDVVVLLAALHKNDAASLARSVPGIDFILGSYGGLVTNAPETLGDTTVLYCGNRGQRIVETRVFMEPGKNGKITAQLNKLHLLSKLYPSDRDMLNFVNSLPRDAPPGGVPATSSAPVEPSTGSESAGP